MSDARTNEVLVTEDQTYRQNEPTHIWVWQLEARHLRLIASYPLQGNAGTAAQPW